MGGYKKFINKNTIIEELVNINTFTIDKLFQARGLEQYKTNNNNSFEDILDRYEFYKIKAKRLDGDVSIHTTLSYVLGYKKYRTGIITDQHGETYKHEVSGLFKDSSDEKIYLRGDTMITSFSILNKYYINENTNEEPESIEEQKKFKTSMKKLLRLIKSEDEKKQKDIKNNIKACYSIGNCLPIPFIYGKDSLNTAKQIYLQDKIWLFLDKIKKYYFNQLTDEPFDCILKEYGFWLDSYKENNKSPEENWENFVDCNYLNSFCNEKYIPIHFFETYPDLKECLRAVTNAIKERHENIIKNIDKDEDLLNNALSGVKCRIIED